MLFISFIRRLYISRDKYCQVDCLRVATAPLATPAFSKERGIGFARLIRGDLRWRLASATLLLPAYGADAHSAAAQLAQALYGICRARHRLPPARLTRVIALPSMSAQAIMLRLLLENLLEPHSARVRLKPLGYPDRLDQPMPIYFSKSLHGSKARFDMRAVRWFSPSPASSCRRA